jgi:prenyltransferase beta subunit
VGVKLLAVAAAAIAVAVPASSIDYVAGRQQADGGFAEAGGRSTAGLTAWSVLALKAADRRPDRPDAAVVYLTRQETPEATDLELRLLALHALGQPVGALADRIASLQEPNGRIGPLVNSTAWGVIALTAADRRPDPRTVRWLLARQARNGGWPWAPGGQPDADDTAVAIQALRAAGVPTRSAAVARGIAYLRRAANRDGGIGQRPGLPSNAQSTAWAIQALVAAGRDPGRPALAYLRALRRADGSYRYSARYGTTPLWVSSYVVAALAKKPFPLR